MKVNMHISTATDMIMNALNRSVRAEFHPFHWKFFTKDDLESVEFVASRTESHYIFTKVKKFLGIKYGYTTIILSSENDELDMVTWHRLGDVLNNAMTRFGVNQ